MGITVKDYKLFKSCVDIWEVETVEDGYLILTKDIDKINDLDVVLHTEILKDGNGCDLPRLDDTKPLAMVNFFSKCITKTINRGLAIRSGKLTCRGGVPSMSRIIIDDYYNDYGDICKLDNDLKSVISAAISKSLNEEGLKEKIRTSLNLDETKTKLVYYKEIKVVKTDFKIKNSILEAGITHRFNDIETIGLTVDDIDSEVIVVGIKNDFIVDLYQDNMTPVIRKQVLSNIFDIRVIDE